MNNDLATIMADCETPYALIPLEMAGIDGEYNSVFDMLDKLLEVNTILKSQYMVVIPSFIENVDGLFVLKYDVRIEEEHKTVIEMFLKPVVEHKLLERIGAEEYARLLPELV